MLNRIITSAILILGGALILFNSQSLIGIICIVAGYMWGNQVKSPAIPATPITLPIIILGLLSLLSLAFVTADFSVSLAATGWLWQGLAGYALILIWCDTTERQIIAKYLLLFLGVVITLLSPFIVDWNQMNISLLPNTFYQQFPISVSNTVHPNTLAAILVMMIPIPLAEIVDKTGSWSSRKSVMLLLVLTFFVLLFITQSRAAWLAISFGLILLLWLHSWRKTAIGVVTFFSLTWILIYIQQSHYSLPAITILANPVSFDFRLDVWHQAIEILADFTFTGIGMGTFNLVAERFYLFPHVIDPGAHNLYFQIGVEIGLLGLIAYISLILATIRVALSALPHFVSNNTYTHISGLCIGLTTLHLLGFLDNTLWPTRIAFLPWLYIGLIISNTLIKL